MAVTGSLYGKFMFGAIGANTVNFLTDTIKVMLCTSGYAPNKDTHQFKSDVTNEVVGAGYTAGGITLTSKTRVYDAPSDTTTFDADDAVWSNAAILTRVAVFYDDTPVGDANKPLIGYVDFGVDRQSFQPGNFTFTFAASGIFTLQAA